MAVAGAYTSRALRVRVLPSEANLRTVRRRRIPNTVTIPIRVLPFAVWGGAEILNPR
ncbi:hypothetical protein GCM10009077_03560 [Roseibium denhamense]